MQYKIFLQNMCHSRIQAPKPPKNTTFYLENGHFYPKNGKTKGEKKAFLGNKYFYFCWLIYAPMLAAGPLVSQN